MVQVTFHFTIFINFHNNIGILSSFLARICKTSGIQNQNPILLINHRSMSMLTSQMCSKGFEPPTHGLEGRCSIQLSYEHIFLNHLLAIHKRVMGIEPTYLAWKASVLPLNYTRMFKSGWQDSNLRPPGPKPGALAKLSHTPLFYFAVVVSLTTK